MKIFSRYYAILILSFGTCLTAIGQQLSINTERVDNLLSQWNLGHNTRNPEIFQRIYYDQVTMHGKNVSREKASLTKKLMFVRNPEYKHRLTGEMKYSLYKNGIVKCDFTKETWQNGKWESSATYLLIGFRKHKYWIVGESEKEIDRKLGITNALGEPVKTETISLEPETSNTLYAETTAPEIPKTSLNTILSGHVYPVLLYGVLPLLALALFVVILRERFTTKKPMAFAGAGAAAAHVVEPKNIVEPKQNVIEPKRQEKPRIPPVEQTEKVKKKVVPTVSSQDAFAKYVLTMFDTKSFTCQEFREGESKFAVETGKRTYTKYKVEYRENDIVWSSFDIYPIYKNKVEGPDVLFPMIGSAFENRRTQRSDLYFVIGIGGDATSPEELYLIPGKDFKLVMDKQQLKAFRRSSADSFVFDSARKELH